MEEKNLFSLLPTSNVKTIEGIKFYINSFTQNVRPLGKEGIYNDIFHDYCKVMNEHDINQLIHFIRFVYILDKTNII